MPVQDPKFLLIVKVPKGLAIRRLPRPEGQGGILLRNVPVGAALMAYGIHNIQGVPYARLVPQNPLIPEWVRVAEADGGIEYVDVIDIGDDTDSRLTDAIHDLADAIRGSKQG